MTVLDILKTILLGLAIAAPVGPISLLCMRTTLNSGFGAGFSAGLGVALADGLVSLVALTFDGMSSSLSAGTGKLLNYGAAAFLIYLGIKMLCPRKSSTAISETPAREGGCKTFLSTFLVTVINPLTLLSFGALFCGSRNTQEGWACNLIIASCIFLGSALWWLLLAAFLTYVRHGLGRTTMRSIDICSGFCILAVGVKLAF